MLDANFFRALCEPVRLELLGVMVRLGRSDVGSIAACMKQDRSVISRHLQILEGSGLVRAMKEGRHMFYEVDGPAFLAKLESLTAELRRIVPYCCPGDGQA